MPGTGAARRLTVCASVVIVVSVKAVSFACVTVAKKGVPEVHELLTELCQKRMSYNELGYDFPITSATVQQILSLADRCLVYVPHKQPMAAFKTRE